MAGLTLSTLRVTVEGPITSFRYAYFAQGVQPSYEMPPPATLYGHVCSALGEQVPPDSFHVSAHFTCAARFMDYEHIHLFGRQPKLSPFRRELLFQPRLTLYIDRPDWLDAFRYPRYVVTLGRSQDLMMYRDVRLVSLTQADEGYVEHTLLPLEEGRRLSSFSAVTMPRWINERREVDWGQYAHARQRQPWAQPVWVDQETDSWRGLKRAVIWLTFA